MANRSFQKPADSARLENTDGLECNVSSCRPTLVRHAVGGKRPLGFGAGANFVVGGEANRVGCKTASARGR